MALSTFEGLVRLVVELIFKLLFTATIVACTYSLQALASEGPVIDVHLHLWSEARLPAPRHPRGIPGAQTRSGLATATLEQMRNSNVVLGLIHEDSESIDLIRRLEPSRFMAFPKAISPAGVPTPSEFEEQLRNNNWSGIGEILTVYKGTRPDDVRLKPYYQVAMENDAPAFWHTGISFPGVTRRDPKYRAGLGKPSLWEDTFVEFPDLRGVLMHGGWPFRDEIVAVLSLYPGIYIDTGAVIHMESREAFYDYFGYLIKAGLGDRILFGSDQMGWPGAIEESISVLTNAPWPEEAKRDILYNNAAKFLGLSPELVDSHHQ